MQIDEQTLLMTPASDPAHLHAWIERYTGLDIPNYTISRFSTSNPFDFLWQVYRAIMDGESAAFLGLAGRDSMKCSRVSTRIHCEKSIKKIQDVRVGDRVWDGKEFQTVLQTFDEGYQPGCEVFTKAGYRLCGSLKHRVQILTKKGIEWKRIQDLTDADHVIISLPKLELEIEPEEYDLGYFVGLLVGDGGVSQMGQNRVSFTNIDPVLVEWYLSYVQKQFGIKPGFDGRCSYVVCRESFCQILENLGFHSVLSIHKTIPEAIWQNRSRALGFLAGFYDTDGTYSPTRTPMIYYQSNQKLLEEVQVLLASFGVFSKIRLSEHYLSSQLALTLNVSGAGVQRLLELGLRSKCSIGPKSQFNDHLARQIKPTQADPIPSKYVKYWADAIDNIRSHGKRIKHIKKSHLDIYASISREKLIRQRNALILAKALPQGRWSRDTFLSQFEVSSIPDWIMNIENIAVDQVKGIRFGEDYFYDLEVANSHAYWSNGIISHNTLGLSVLDLLAMLHDRRNIVHVAMTSIQGSRARNYLDSFINKQEIIKHSVVKQNTREIRLMVDNVKVGLEIVPATPKAVQGSHASVLTFDEIASSVEPNNVRAYRDAHGILGSSEKGKPAVTVKITSRQQGFSLAEQELRDAVKSNLKVLRWTTLDVTEKCPDERSGTIKTPLWIHPLKGEKLTEKEFESLPEVNRDGFQFTDDTFDGCRQCVLAPFCAGDLKKQKSHSFLLRTIDDVISKIRLAGAWDWAVAQIMSLKPSTEGTIYVEFDRQVHVPGWNVMWETLTGEIPSHEITREMFIQKLKDCGASFYAGIDWGWSAPSTCVVMAVDRKEFCYVVEAIGKTYTPDPEFISIIKKTLHKKYNIQMYCPDLANGSGNALLRQAGLPTTDNINKSINLGINLVKGLLRVPGANGLTRIYFAPDLESSVPGSPGIIEEFELYHKKTDAAGRIQDDADPAEEYDHSLDSVRYMVYWLFGRSRMQLGGSLADPDKRTEKSNIPSLQEISRQYGVNYIDNRTPEQIADTDFDDPRGPLFTWT